MDGNTEVMFVDDFYVVLLTATSPEDHEKNSKEKNRNFRFCGLPLG